MQFEKHIREKHEGLKDRKKCNFCHETFDSMSSLNKHITNQHLPETDIGTKFNVLHNQPKSLLSNNRATFNSHSSSENVSIIRQESKMDHKKLSETIKKIKQDFQCIFCEKTFTSAHNLKKHTKSTHEERKENKCDFCIKSFSSAIYLNIHVRYFHQGWKTLPCEICEKNFNLPASLKKHIREKHEGLKDRKKCNFCNEVFDSKSILDAHITSQHLPETEVDIKNKPFLVRLQHMLNSKSNTTATDISCDLSENIQDQNEINLTENLYEPQQHSYVDTNSNFGNEENHENFEIKNENSDENSVDPLNIDDHELNEISNNSDNYEAEENVLEIKNEALEEYSEKLTESDIFPNTNNPKVHKK